MQDRYIDFLRGMFKGTEPTRFIALAFLTGILPIKKLKTQSTLNNFDEFTMLSSGDFASYIGFTEAEVKTLAEKYNQDYEKLKGKKLRMTRVRVPGKEVCLAHVINPSQSCIYQNLGLHIGVHEGEDHTGEAIGMIRFTPWEAVVVAADIAVKSANVEIGFMDRFSGSLILTGGLTEVQTAVEEVVKFFREVLGFKTCAVHKS